MHLGRRLGVAPRSVDQHQESHQRSRAPSLDVEPQSLDVRVHLLQDEGDEEVKPQTTTKMTAPNSARRSCTSTPASRPGSRKLISCTWVSESLNGSSEQPTAA